MSPSGIPRLGGVAAFSLFGLILVAFVVQSSLTQHVQVALGYRQPFLLFYIAHSSFAVIFPLHLLYLTRTSGIPAKAYILGLKTALATQLGGKGLPSSQSSTLPFSQYLVLVLKLTACMTVPGLLWYAAVSLASISDVTAIWNTNAFWAYLITVKLYNGKWEAQKLSAVLLACFGVLFVVYGGQDASTKPDDPAPASVSSKAPVLGIAMTLVASIAYGAYQVYYKHSVALPSDGVEIIGDYEAIPSDSEANDSSATQRVNHDIVHPPPFALYPNLITSSVGVCTLLALWPILPILDWLNVESFTPPPNLQTWLSVIGIASAGLVFNGSYMVLLGVWGPILVSVASLLTIVAMLIADVFFFGGEAVTLWGLLGCGMIAGGFGVLVWDVLKSRR